MKLEFERRLRLKDQEIEKLRKLVQKKYSKMTKSNLQTLKVSLDCSNMDLSAYKLNQDLDSLGYTPPHKASNLFQNQYKVSHAQLKPKQSLLEESLSHLDTKRGLAASQSRRTISVMPNLETERRQRMRRVSMYKEYI